MKLASATKRSFWNSWSGVCTILLGAALLFFLVTEHTAHFFGVLPWAIILVCPFLHLFMHKGHGAHGGHDGQGDQAETAARTVTVVDSNSLPEESHPHGGKH